MEQKPNPDIRPQQWPPHCRALVGSPRRCREKKISRRNHNALTVRFTHLTWRGRTYLWMKASTRTSLLVRNDSEKVLLVTYFLFGLSEGASIFQACELLFPRQLDPCSGRGQIAFLSITWVSFPISVVTKFNKCHVCLVNHKSWIWATNGLRIHFDILTFYFSCDLFLSPSLSYLSSTERRGQTKSTQPKDGRYWYDGLEKMDLWGLDRPDVYLLTFITQRDERVFALSEKGIKG